MLLPADTLSDGRKRWESPFRSLWKGFPLQNLLGRLDWSVRQSEENRTALVERLLFRRAACCRFEGALSPQKSTRNRVPQGVPYEVDVAA